MSKAKSKHTLANKACKAFFERVLRDGIVELECLFTHLNEIADGYGYRIRCEQHGIRGVNLSFEKTETRQ